MQITTTVQEKAIAYPADGKLYDAMRRKLAWTIQDADIVLRQRYTRCGKRILTALGRIAREHHNVGIRKPTCKLRTYRCRRWTTVAPAE